VRLRERRRGSPELRRQPLGTQAESIESLEAAPEQVPRRMPDHPARNPKMPCPHVREIPPPRAVDGGGEMTEDRRSTGSPTASPRPPARAPCGRALRAAGARIPRDRTAQVSSALSLTDRFHGCRCPRGPPRDPVNETAGSATGARGTGDPCGRLAMRDGFVKCRRNRTRDRKIGQHRTHIGRKSDRGPTGANPLKWRICAASRRMARAGQRGEGRECDGVAHLTVLNEINELAADPCLRVVFRDWGLAEKATVLTQSSAARQRADSCVPGRRMRAPQANARRRLV
jgi:hypothetical protein